MVPLQLQGGSLLLQLSPEDVASPGKLYQALMMMMGNLNTFERKVAACLNGAASATTAGRPTTAGLPAGWMMFDTTLGKPIWWSGSNWRDATGSPV